MSRRAGKTRHPWGVYGLTIITFGIYMLVWYYKVNAEARDYERTIDVKPGIALVALCLPIASLVTMIKTAGRIQRTQVTSGSTHRCSWLIGLLLVVCFGTWIVYYQSQLNKTWDMYGNPPKGTIL